MSLNYYILEQQIPGQMFRLQTSLCQARITGSVICSLHLPNIVLLQLGQDSRDLSCSQPTVGSAKPPEEDDHTSLVFPKILECCFLLGDSVSNLTVTNLCWLHITSANNTINSFSCRDSILLMYVMSLRN